MSNEIEKNIESFQEIAVAIAKGINATIERMQPTIAVFTQAFENFQKKYEPLFKGFISVIGEMVERAKAWQKEQKVSVSAMAEEGWFPNWFTFFYTPEEKCNSFDDLMIGQIDDCWEELQNKIIEFVPNRKHILEVAFDLHAQGNYIASIPLLLSQSDGICSEEFTHFFSKDNETGLRANAEIIKQAINNELTIDFFSEILLEPFKVNLQLSKSSSKASRAAKEKGPNRHGIIHGSRKHLDYGSKVNGYKALSFLAFIVFTVKDQFKKT